MLRIALRVRPGERDGMLQRLRGPPVGVARRTLRCVRHAAGRPWINVSTCVLAEHSPGLVLHLMRDSSIGARC